MRIERLAHVGITVIDLDAALAFYVGVLGFTVDGSRPNFGFDGAWLDTGQGQVHLLVSNDPTPGPAHHLALQVDDIEAWDAHLTSAGLTHRRLRYFPAAGHQIFVTDPSGNTVELNQPTPV